VFGLTFVNIPRAQNIRLQFAIDVDTMKITLIGVPSIALCE
jgi:hypothetical protein